MSKYKIQSERKAQIVKQLEAAPAISVWQVAQHLGVHENTVYKWMRMPNDEQMARITDAIAAIRQN